MSKSPKAPKMPRTLPTCCGLCQHGRDWHRHQEMDMLGQLGNAVAHQRLDQLQHDGRQGACANVNSSCVQGAGSMAGLAPTTSNEGHSEKGF